MNSPEYDVQPDPNNPLRPLIEAVVRRARTLAREVIEAMTPGQRERWRDMVGARLFDELMAGPIGTPITETIALHPSQMAALAVDDTTSKPAPPPPGPARRLNRAQRRALARGRR